MPSALASCPAAESAQLAGGHRPAPNTPTGAGRMESALAQVGMAGAPDRDRGLVAGDHGLDQRLRR